MRRCIGRCIHGVLLTTAAAFLPAGCAALDTVDHASSGLERIDAASLSHTLQQAFAHRHDTLAALRISAAWFDRPDSAAHFDGHASGVTHQRAERSVKALIDLLESSASAEAFAQSVVTRFELHQSIGRDGDGQVLFTGYFAPQYKASREQTERFRFPLYRPPVELAPDNSDHVVWNTRRTIEDEHLLAGRELAWLGDALDAYLVHVNGSAQLLMRNGSVMNVGHAGTNERPYTSLGRLLIDAGLAEPEEMSMQTIRALHRAHPAAVEALMRCNDRYVFFRELDDAQWPRSSLGVPLTAQTSIATDKLVFPPGMAALVVTSAPEGERASPFVRLCVDQDRGGAIIGPGRADIYFGIGPQAGAIAGRMAATGRLYYLVLRDE